MKRNIFRCSELSPRLRGDWSEEHGWFRAAKPGTDPSLERLLKAGNAGRPLEAFLQKADCWKPTIGRRAVLGPSSARGLKAGQAGRAALI